MFRLCCKNRKGETARSLLEQQVPYLVARGLVGDQERHRM